MPSFGSESVSPEAGLGGSLRDTHRECTKTTREPRSEESARGHFPKKVAGFREHTAHPTKV